MKGGYYRVDLNDKISVLSLNTLYFDSEREKHTTTFHGSSKKAKEQLDWLKAQLGEQSDRQFIVISHVYPGARYNNFELWNDKPNKVYFDILKEFQDKILIELAGHDHFASLRASVTQEGDLFHNMFIAPSITPWYKNNPGVTSFEITEDLIPQGLRSTFLNLSGSFGHDDPLPADQLEFRHLDFEEHFGIKKMTPDEIWALAMRLIKDRNVHEDYLIRKMGLDPEIDSELKQGIQILLDKGLVV